jgi:hypothetical protein
LRGTGDRAFVADVASWWEIHINAKNRCARNAMGWCTPG